MMEKVEFTKETKPKEIFVYTCQRIAEPFIPLGYNYLKSKNAIIKKGDEFTFGIYFQPSIRCGSTTFLVHVAIHSKKLGEWRKIKYDINTNNDVVLSTSLARLEPIPLGLFYLPFWTWAVLKILTYYVYAPVFARCPCPNWLRQ